MLKILPARLQQYMNWELPDVQAEFRKGRDQIAYLSWIIGKERKFEKNIYFCFINYAKAFDCVVHTQSKREREWERERERNLGKILKEMGEPDYLTCLLRTLYVDQEAIVRTRYGTMDWFKIGKWLRKAVNCHLAYLMYMQSTSCEMPGWMKYKLESKLPGGTSVTSDMPHL